MKAANDTFTCIRVVLLSLKSENQKLWEVILLEFCHCSKNLEMSKSFLSLSTPTKFTTSSVNSILKSLLKKSSKKKTFKTKKPKSSISKPRAKAGTTLICSKTQPTFCISGCPINKISQAPKANLKID
jgi:hypothetical protein